MLLSLVHTTFTSPFESKTHINNLNPITTTSLLPKSLFPDFQTNAFKTLVCLSSKRRSSHSNRRSNTTTQASLLEAPVLWAGRLCIFYALLKAGLAGSQSNPLVSGLLLFLYIPHFFASFFLWVINIFSFFFTLFI